MAESTVTVRIADVEPIAGFIREVAAAESHFRRLTQAEVAALPPAAVRGFTELQAALERLSHPLRTVTVKADTADTDAKLSAMLATTQRQSAVTGRNRA
jgi:hypothetical protein